MNGLDLNQFQFDYDQTWAVLFFRHDGTLITRYGTRGDTNGMTYNSLDTFVATMKTALAVDRSWTAQSVVGYRGKLGPKVRPKTADEIPSETIRKIQQREREGEQSCIHCHNVYDARRDADISAGNYDPAKRYKYPLPSQVGFKVQDAATLNVVDVEPGSSAHIAGLRAGQTLLSMNGQRVHTLADIQFVLHHTDETATLPVVVGNPDGDNTSLVLRLHPGWRAGNISWRVSMYGMPPRAGLWVEELTLEEKADLDIADEAAGLRIRGVFGKEVRAAGLKKGDIVTGFGSQSGHSTAGEFHAYVRLNYYRPNSQLKMTLLRNGNAVERTVVFPNSQQSR